MRATLLRLLAILAAFGLGVDGVPVLATTLPTTTPFYGAAVSTDQLATFNRVVAEVGNYDGYGRLHKHVGQVCTYAILGEIEAWCELARSLPKSLFRRANLESASRIANLSTSSRNRYLLGEQIAPLWTQGYSGLFLDKSYSLVDDSRAATRKVVRNAQAFSAASSVVG
jgi:hypothetical protein